MIWYYGRDLICEVVALDWTDTGGSCSGKVMKKKPQIDLVSCQWQAEQPCFVSWSEAR